MLHRWLTTLLVVMIAAASTSANIVVPAEFRELVTDAGLIVRGRVTDVRSAVVPGAGIDSFATVAVESVLKGTASSFVTVRVPGGEVGRTRFVMVGAPTLRPGDRAVFLLKRDADNYWRPVGLSMGLYRVHVDAVTGATTVAAPIVIGQTASTGPIVRGDVRRKAMPVAQLESLIRLISLDRVASPRVRR